jgi:hypothetical protein
MDPKPVKMAIGYGIYHPKIPRKKKTCTVSVKPSHEKTQEYTVATHKAN